MGIVWRAHDERLHRTVAVKQLLLPPGLSDQETTSNRRRALREARIAARLQHPNAIVVFDITEHEGEPCLVMEYMPSRSLAAILGDSGPLPAQDVAAIGRQVAAALAAAHAAGIVHRDVKPGNVLIDEAGTAKITDFGISRAAGDATLTQTGILAGTPAYLAPEVARGQDPTPASDVFSLGATLYAAVEGRTPFGENQNQLALLHSVAAGKVEPPGQSGPLTDLLMTLLRVDAAERPGMEQARAGFATVQRSSGASGPAAAATGTVVPAATVAGPRRDDQPPPTSTLGGTPPPTQPSARPVADRSVVPPSPAAPPPRPVAAPEPGRLARPSRRTTVAVALVAVVLALSSLLIFAVLAQSDNERAAPSGRPPAAAPAPRPAPSGPAVPQPAPQPAAPDPSGGPIEFSPAGQLVIDYYNGLDDLDSAWAMLSERAQASFGGRAGFDQYWGQYSEVSAQNAQGVTRNEDGTVNVPVDVTYNGSGVQQEKRVLRITRVGGELLIDSDAR